MYRCFGVAIYSLVVATSMFPVIFFETCRHWLTRLSLVRSCVGSSRYVGIFLPIFPLLVKRSLMSSWLWARTCCILSTVPVHMGGYGYSGETLFAIFAWCLNSAERRITMSSTMFAWPWPACSRVNYPVLVSFGCSLLKLVFKAIHVFWIWGSQLQYLVYYWNFPVLLMIL